MKATEFRKLIREEVSKAIMEAPITAPTTYDYNNPGDEWKAIFDKAIQRFTAYRQNPKVKKDTANLIMAVYKLGGKKIGKNLKPDYLTSAAERVMRDLDPGDTAADLIPYIKSDLDPTAIPSWADPRSLKPFKAGKWVRITPQTKLKVGDELTRIGDLYFADIVKMEGDKFLLHFDIDYSDEKPTKADRKYLEDYWFLMQKK